MWPIRRASQSSDSDQTRHMDAILRDNRGELNIYRILCSSNTANVESKTVPDRNSNPNSKEIYVVPTDWVNQTMGSSHRKMIQPPHTCVCVCDLELNYFVPIYCWFSCWLISNHSIGYQELHIWILKEFDREQQNYDEVGGCVSLSCLVFFRF